MPSTLDRPSKMETTQSRSFVRAILPWLTAAVMLLFFLITLNKVVNIQSVWSLARINGIDWRPAYVAPLTWLVTLPAKWLPSGGQLIGLNFIAALCAGLSLALLARAVSILPHDRTQLQRLRATDENAFLSIRLAWVPVVLAVMVCAFQRSFWEHAVVGTGEMLDLLLFAFCVRSLLEYRLEENNSWLYKLAVVYGIGIANNFAMIAFFPVLLVALVWAKGLRFFRFDFLSRMFLLGLAGLSFYLLLPAIQSQSDIVPASFWYVLKANFAFQKHLIFEYRKVAFLPAIYALVPILLMGVRWPNSFGDQSPLGSLFANAAAVILHAGLLVFCIYVAFDPPISPRETGAPLRQAGFNYIFLPCYFLGALAIGYYSGFLLLVFSRPEGKMRQRFNVPPAMHYAVTAIVCVGALFAVGALLATNYPKMQRFNSRTLQSYATAAIKSLPNGPAVVMSDDPTRLYAVNALLDHAAAQKYMLIDTRTLSDPSYHRFLRKRYGGRFPQLQILAGYDGFPSSQLLQLMTDLGQKNQLTYLHPSFGYYFEKFYLEPRNLVYTLRPYPPNVFEPPVPSAALIAQQQSYWDSLASGPLKDLKAELASLPAERSPRYEFTAPFVGDFYAHALDHWGVELQRANRFDDAFAVFNQALALGPDNVSALVNRDANALWRKEHKRLPSLSREHQEKLELYRGVTMLLTSCGPVDEASFISEFANIFVQGGLYLQAEQMLARGLSYAPDDVVLQTAMANVNLMAQQPERALAIVSSIRNTEPAVRIEIARIEAFAYLAQTNLSRARDTLEKTVGEFPDADAAYNALAQLYVSYSDRLRATGNIAAADAELGNAIKVIDRQLQRQPKNPAAYFVRGNIEMFATDYTNAVASFTQALQLQRDNGAALLNRAIANLQANRLDAAKADYEDFQRRFTPNYQVYYGLAEIAYRQNDWKAAREQYQWYLRRSHGALPGEIDFVRRRLEEVKKK